MPTNSSDAPPSGPVTFSRRADDRVANDPSPGGLDGAARRWNILYRGPLTSCNYDCAYCPFAKTTNTRAELDHDRNALDRFVRWVGAQRQQPIGVLFTPWGEALVHRYYQRALTELSWFDNVERVAIQTNLSGGTAWLDEANRDTIALWATYHPTQTTRAAFLAKCTDLRHRGVRFSVGMVGLRDDLDEIEAVRAAIDPSIYLWVNAYKDEPDYYNDDEIARLMAVDPLFAVNLNDYDSLGRACHAGHHTFSVDGDGAVRRCHFIAAPIGNIYEPDFATALAPRPCTNTVCGCHIGYIHQPDLGLYDTFGPGLLERIPATWPT